MPRGKINHGLSAHPLFRKHQEILRRCYNKNCQAYRLYGGRGIKMCKRWIDPMTFFKDLIDAYNIHVKKFGERNTTIERINNDGDYKPSNIIFATYRQQSRNKRNNKFIKWKNKKLTLVDWAEETGIERRTIHRRLKLGWSIKDALTIEPVVGRNQYSRKK